MEGQGTQRDRTDKERGGVPRLHLVHATTGGAAAVMTIGHPTGTAGKDWTLRL